MALNRPQKYQPPGGPPDPLSAELVTQVYRDLTRALLTVWPIMFGDEDVLLGDSPRRA